MIIDFTQWYMSILIIIIGIYVAFFLPRPAYVIPEKLINKIKSRTHSIIIIIIIFLTALLPLNIHINTGKKIIPAFNKNIVVLFDVSLSTAADDIKPSRFEAARNSYLGLIEKMKGYTIATIIFSGIPFLYQPLSSDTSAIKEKISSMQLSDFPPTIDFVGTAIGDALLMGMKQLTLTGQTASGGVIILITDGDSNKGSNPDDILPLLSQINIPVFTLGIGNANFVIGNDKTNIPVNTSINIDLLQKISEQTAGKFYRIISEKDLEQVFNDIVSKIKSTEGLTTQEQFFSLQRIIVPFVIILLLLLVFIKIYTLRGLRKTF